MNTFKKVGILFSALFILAACNNKTGTDGSQTSSTSESQETTLSAEQILKNTQDAMAKVKNYQIDMKISSSIFVVDKLIDLESNSVSQVFLNPLLVKTTIAPSSESGSVQEMVQYADSQFFYIPNLETGGWYKSPMDKIISSNSYDTFYAMLSKLTDLSSKMITKTEGANYSVSLHLEGADTEEFSKLIDGEFAKYAPKYTSVDLAFLIDKTTFLPTSTRSEMAIDTSTNSSESSTESSNDGTKVVTEQIYSKFNQVEPFTIPEETKNAEPLEQQ